MSGRIYPAEPPAPAVDAKPTALAHALPSSSRSSRAHQAKHVGMSNDEAATSAQLHTDAPAPAPVATPKHVTQAPAYSSRSTRKTKHPAELQNSEHEADEPLGYPEITVVNKYFSFDAFNHLLRDECVALVRSTFLLNYTQPIECRQNLEEHAMFFGPLKLGEKRHRSGQLMPEHVVIALSFVWAPMPPYGPGLTHPDPGKFYLSTVQKVLRHMFKTDHYCEKKNKTYIFWDWMSLFQTYTGDLIKKAVRDPRQNQLFERALASMQLWYGNAHAQIWMLTIVPPYSDREYEDRGWCQFEMRVGSIVKPSHMCLDLGLLSRDLGIYDQRWWFGDNKCIATKCSVTRPLPMLPVSFRNYVLPKLDFSIEADRIMIADLYERTFNEIIAEATELCWPKVGWCCELRALMPIVVMSAPTLVVFDLSENKLQGPVPEALGELNKLTCINLCGNQLYGPIPQKLCNLGQTLTDLDLSSNQLTGSIPKEIGQLSLLGWLHLRRNEMRGPLPVELGQLTRLEELDLSFNNFTGPIPEVLAHMPQLSQLVLKQNKLTGLIPKALGNLLQLKCVDLSRNELSGPLPKELGQLTQLSQLMLNNNKLKGFVPSEVGQLKQLQRLDLEDNKLIVSIVWKYMLKSNLPKCREYMVPHFPRL